MRMDLTVLGIGLSVLLLSCIDQTPCDTSKDPECKVVRITATPLRLEKGSEVSLDIEFARKLGTDAQVNFWLSSAEGAPCAVAAGMPMTTPLRGPKTGPGGEHSSTGVHFSLEDLMGLKIGEIFLCVKLTPKPSEPYTFYIGSTSLRLATPPKFQLMAAQKTNTEILDIFVTPGAPSVWVAEQYSLAATFTKLSKYDYSNNQFNATAPIAGFQDRSYRTVLASTSNAGLFCEYQDAMPQPAPLRVSANGVTAAWSANDTMSFQSIGRPTMTTAQDTFAIANRTEVRIGDVFIPDIAPPGPPSATITPRPGMCKFATAQDIAPALGMNIDQNGVHVIALTVGSDKKPSLTLCDGMQTIDANSSCLAAPFIGIAANSKIALGDLDQDGVTDIIVTSVDLLNRLSLQWLPGIAGATGASCSSFDMRLHSVELPVSIMGSPRGLVVKPFFSTAPNAAANVVVADGTTFYLLANIAN